MRFPASLPFRTTGSEIQLTPTPVSSGFAPNVSTNEIETVAARLVIIESNRAKAELLAYFLRHTSSFPTIAIETNARSGIALIAASRPELVVATLTPADFPTADFIRELRQAAPAAKVVLLASEINDYLVHAVASAEHHGLLYEPDEDLDTLRDAVACAQRGARFISARFIQSQRHLRSEPYAFPKILSPREQEVLSCIARSLSDGEISAELGCSAGTVLSHRRKLMYKLGIHSTPKLIRYGMEHGFNSTPPFRS